MTQQPPSPSPNFYLPQPTQEEDAPNFWNNPDNLGRYYFAINSGLISQSGAPDWLDQQAIRDAWEYMKYSNGLKPWDQWQRLPESDPGAQWLRTIPAPPLQAMTPAEQGRYGGQSVDAALAYQQAVDQQVMNLENMQRAEHFGLTDAEWDEQPLWKKAVMGVLGTGYLQAAMTGLTGGAIGSLLGPAGMVAGAVGGAAYGWQAMQEQQEAAAEGRPVSDWTLPLIWMDTPWQWLEQGLGGAAQLYGSMVDPEKFGTLDDVIKNAWVKYDFDPANPLQTLTRFKGGPTWEAGRGFYETGGFGLSEPIFGLAQAIPGLGTGQITPGLLPESANPEDILKWLTPGGDDQKYAYTMTDPNAVPVASMGEALYEMRRRLAAAGATGETLEQIYSDVTERYGVSGMTDDLLAGFLLDPLDKLPEAVNWTGARLARKANRPQLATAFEMTSGPTQALQFYGKQLRLTPTDQLQAMHLNAIERTLAGLNKELQPTIWTPQNAQHNVFQRAGAYLLRLTPQARANEIMGNAVVQLEMLMADKSPEQVERLLTRLVEMPDDLAAEMSMQFLKSPEGRILPQLVTGFSDKLRAMLDVWQATAADRATISAVADLAGIKPEEVMKRVKHGGADLLVRQVTERARTMQTEAAKGVLRAIESGELTGAKLRSLLDNFVQNKLPWNEALWVQQLAADLVNHAQDALIQRFGIKPDPKWSQFGQLIKGAQSLVLLGINPVYMINNVINNAVTLAAQGVFGMRKMADIEAYWQRMGMTPARLKSGIGAGAMGDVLDFQGLRAATRAPGVMGDLLQFFNRDLKKFQIMSNLAAKNEAWNSAQAMTAGHKKAWSHLWRRGRGFDRMPTRLENIVRETGGDALVRMVYESIESGVSKAEIEAALWSEIGLRGIDALVGDIARQTGKGAGEIREMLDVAGALDYLKDRLKGNLSNADVDQVFTGLRSHVENYWNERYQEAINTTVEEARARTEAEGAQAALDLLDNDTLEWLDRYLSNNREWVMLFEDANKLEAGQRNALIRSQFEIERAQWNRYWRHYKARMSGIIKGLGLDNEAGRAYMGGAEELINLWQKFHQDARSKRDKFFATEYPNYNARATAWYTLLEELDEMYQAAAKQEGQINQRMANTFAATVAAKYGETGRRAALDWRKAVQDVRDRQVREMRAHRKAMRDDTLMDAEAQNKAWQEFYDGTYNGLLLDQARTTLEGARALYEVTIGGAGRVTDLGTEIPETSRPQVASRPDQAEAPAAPPEAAAPAPEPVIRVETEQVAVDRGRVQELVDEGMTLDQARRQAIDEARAAAPEPEPEATPEITRPTENYRVEAADILNDAKDPWTRGNAVINGVTASEENWNQIWDILRQADRKLYTDILAGRKIFADIEAGDLAALGDEFSDDVGRLLGELHDIAIRVQQSELITEGTGNNAQVTGTLKGGSSKSYKELANLTVYDSRGRKLTRQAAITEAFGQIGRGLVTKQMTIHKKILGMLADAMLDDSPVLRRKLGMPINRKIIRDFADRIRFLASTEPEFIATQIAGYYEDYNALVDQVQEWYGGDVPDFVQEELDAILERMVTMELAKPEPETAQPAQPAQPGPETVADAFPPEPMQVPAYLSKRRANLAVGNEFGYSPFNPATPDALVNLVNGRLKKEYVLLEEVPEAELRQALTETAAAPTIEPVAESSPAPTEAARPAGRSMEQAIRARLVEKARLEKLLRQWEADAREPELRLLPEGDPRESIRRGAIDIMGVPEAEVDDYMRLLDARARVWSIYTGLPEAEYYRSGMAGAGWFGMTRGIDADLMQARVGTPEYAENFRAWFGDSKVIDARGNPLPVYHGSPAVNIKSFFMSRSHASYGQGAYFTNSKEFASNYAEWRDGGAVYPVYLKIEKPLVLSFEGDYQDMGVYGLIDSAGIINTKNIPGLPDWIFREMVDRLTRWREKKGWAYRYEILQAGFSMFRDIAKEYGYDGVIVDVNTRTQGHREYVVFDQRQIKSALGNRGDFDTRYNSILMQRASAETQAVIDALEQIGTIPVETAAQLLGRSYDTPEYLAPLVDHLVSKREQFLAGKTTEGQVARALLMTTASQQATEQRISTIQAKLDKWGVQFTIPESATITINGERYIRPEDAMGAWLLSERGRWAIAHLAEYDRQPGTMGGQPMIVNGKQNPSMKSGSAWDDMAAIRLAFGDNRLDNLRMFDKELTGKNVFNLRNIDELTRLVNEAALEYRNDNGAALNKILERTNGISSGKVGFVKHLIGMGDTPTLDAVEISYWLTGEASADIRKLDDSLKRMVIDFDRKKNILSNATMRDMFMNRTRANFAELYRMGYVNDLAAKYGDEVAQDIFMHVLHHWLWDRAKGTETSHQIGMDAMALLQKQGAPKAGVQFMDDGRVLMMAFQGPDLSSLIHETGHIFRRELGAADMEVVTSWLHQTYGVQVRSINGRFDGDGQMLRVDAVSGRVLDEGGVMMGVEEWAEERFARAFERYIADGTAPTVGLKRIFERLKRWMLEIYATITGSEIDVPISQELRGVFDRLLNEDAARAETMGAPMRAPDGPMVTPGGQASFLGPQESLVSQKAPADTFTPKEQGKQGELFARPEPVKVKKFSPPVIGAAEMLSKISGAWHMGDDYIYHLAHNYGWDKMDVFGQIALIHPDYGATDPAPTLRGALDSVREILLEHERAGRAEAVRLAQEEASTLNRIDVLRKLIAAADDGLDLSQALTEGEKFLASGERWLNRYEVQGTIGYTISLKARQAATELLTARVDTPETAMTPAERAGFEKLRPPKAVLLEGKVGPQVVENSRIKTLSGRFILIPKQIDITSERAARKAIRITDQWLLDNAIGEAAARGDTWNKARWEHIDPKRLTPAERDEFNVYLFGEENPVIYLKPPGETTPAENTPIIQGDQRSRQAPITDPEIAKYYDIFRDQTQPREVRQKAIDTVRILEQAAQTRYADGRPIKQMIDEFIAEGATVIKKHGPRVFIQNEDATLRWLLIDKLSQDYARHRIDNPIETPATTAISGEAGAPPEVTIGSRNAESGEAGAALLSPGDMTPEGELIRYATTLESKGHVVNIYVVSWPEQTWGESKHVAFYHLPSGGKPGYWVTPEQIGYLRDIIDGPKARTGPLWDAVQDAVRAAERAPEVQAPPEMVNAPIEEPAASVEELLTGKLQEPEIEQGAPEPAAEQAGEMTREGRLLAELAGRLARGELFAKQKDFEDLARALGFDLQSEAELNLAYDVFEGALNMRARDVRAQLEMEGKDLGVRLAMLATLETQLTEARRTLMKSQFQQFSTPLPISEAAGVAADVRSGDVVGEPTAGVANLVEKFQGRDDLTIRVNEIDPGRQQVLRLLGYNPTALNLMQPEWVIQGGKLAGPWATVQISNPPWGSYSTGKYGKAINVPVAMNDWSQRFVYLSMQRLADNGRIVGVMPTNWVYTMNRRTREITLRRSLFVQWLEKNYTLRAIIESPPDAYKQRGTDIGSLLVVIDKHKAPEGHKILEAFGDKAPANWGQYANLVKQIGRRSVDSSIEAIPTGPEASGIIDPAAVRGEMESTPENIGNTDLVAKAIEDGKRANTEDITGRSNVGGRVTQPGDTGTAPGGYSSGEPGTDVSGLPEQREATGLVEREQKQFLADANRAVVERRAADVERARTAAKDSSIYVPYVGRSPLGPNDLQVAHPAVVMESKTLAGIPYPALEEAYRPTPGVMNALNRRVLSVEGNLDPIWAAVQQNDKHGMGILIADDVGMGKSRTAAGFVIDRLERGQQRVLVVTKDWQNVTNLIEEFRAVYSGTVDETGRFVDTGSSFPAEMIKLEAKDFGFKRDEERILPITDGPVVYFLAWSQFNDWAKTLAEADLQTVVVDEVHMFKGEDGTAQYGPYWKLLHQSILANGASVMYLSATPGTDVADLRYLYGLKAWTMDGFDGWIRYLKGELSIEELEKKNATMKRVMEQTKKLRTDSQNVEVDRNGTYISLRENRNGYAEFDKRQGKWFVKYERANVGYMPSEAKAIMALQFAHEEGAALKEPAQMFAALERVRQRLATEYPDFTRQDANDLGIKDIDDLNTMVDDEKKRRRFEGKGGLSAFETTLPSGQTEQVMRELKVAGSYLSRDINRAGVTFDVMEFPLQQADRKFLNDRVRFYRDVLTAFQDQPGNEFGPMSFIQNDAKRSLFHLRLTKIMPEIDKALANGEKVVLSVISVSGVEDKNPTLEAAIKTIGKETLVADPETGELSAGIPPEVLIVRNQLMERMKELGSMPNPIDVLAQRYGDRFDSITGKITNADMRRRIAQSFQHDDIDIVLISKAGKTGINLHTLTDKPVHMIVLDYEWEASTFKQELGRVDRTGQTRSPIISITSLGTSSEKKFIATVLARMRGLGATAKGSEEAASFSAFANFELGSFVDRMAISNMWSRLPEDLKDNFLGSAFKMRIEDKDGNVFVLPKPQIDSSPTTWKQFLLEMMTMDIDAAQEIFDAFLKVKGEMEGTDIYQEWTKQKTDSSKGVRIRSSKLNDSLTLDLVEDDSGRRYGLLRGVITPYLQKLRKILSNDQTGNLLDTSWMSWTRLLEKETDTYLSGMEVKQYKMQAVLDFFGALVEHTPENALRDLDAGDKIPVKAPDGDEFWMLYKGSGGERIGKIIVDGARKKNQDLLAKYGAQYNAIGNFFYVPEDDLPRFLTRFKILDKGNEQPPQTGGMFDTPDGPRRVLYQREQPGPETPAPNGETPEAVRVQGPGGVEDVAIDRPAIDPVRLPLGSVENAASMPDMVKMQEQAWNNQVWPVLLQLQQKYKDPNARNQRTLKNARVDPETTKEMKVYLDKVYGQMADTKLASLKFAEQQRDAALLNYGERRGIDNVLQMVFPYSFWTTRSAINWALRVMDRPAWISKWYRARRAQEEMEDRKGFPARLRGKMRIPAPFLPDWMGDSIYIDPLKQVFPFEQLINPFMRKAQEQQTAAATAVYIIQEWVESEEISNTEGADAIRDKKGPVWDRALAQAGAEESGGGVWDFATMLTSPSLPIQWIANAVQGNPEASGPLPLTRQVRAITAALGANQGRGINLEGPVRRALAATGVQEWDEFETYRVDRALANMAAEGVPVEEILQAMVDKQGPLYVEAQRRAAQEGTVRTMGSMVGADLFPEGEQEQRALKQLFNQAIEAREAGDKQALNKFFDQYPQYEARLALMQSDPEERMRRILIGQVWDKYTALPTLDKQAAQDQLGELFAQRFLQSETRNYDEISTVDLARFARLLGGKTPATAPATPREAFLRTDPQISAAYETYRSERDRLFPGLQDQLNKYYALPQALQDQRGLPQGADDYYRWKDDYLANNPALIPYLIGDDNKVAGVDADIQALYYQYKSTMNRQFPNVYALQDHYYALPSNQRAAFLAANPALSQYWEFRREFMRQYPQMIPYLYSVEGLANKVLGDNYSSAGSGDYNGGGQYPTRQSYSGASANQGVSYAEMRKFTAALIRQLYSYFLGGIALTDGARRELALYAGGDVEAYLERLRPSFTPR